MNALVIGSIIAVVLAIVYYVHHCKKVTQAAEGFKLQKQLIEQAKKSIGTYSNTLQRRLGMQTASV